MEECLGLEAFSDVAVVVIFFGPIKEEMSKDGKVCLEAHLIRLVKLEDFFLGGDLTTSAYEGEESEGGVGDFLFDLLLST